MVKAVELLLQNKLYTSVLVLIVCTIDAFAKGDKHSYLRILRQHFSGLTKSEMSAPEFYRIYRNGMVHRLRPDDEYGLAENKELEGDYYGTVYIPKSTTSKKERYLKAIDIDRLSEDFLKLARTVSKNSRTVEGLP